MKRWGGDVSSRWGSAVWVRWLSVPLEQVYRFGTALRNLAYDRGLLSRVEMPVPVISVGNLAVGGTGKTPVAAWLVRWLRERGRRPALLSRGYGGDEVELHRAWNPDVPVWVDADRVRSARRAITEGADVLVLDDGFQHRRLARDVDLVLCAAEHPTRIHRLPRGPFREGLPSLERADAVIVTVKTGDSRSWRALLASVSGPDVLGEVRLRPSGWCRLDGSDASAPESDVVALSGIAAPSSFHAMVQDAVNGRVEPVVYPDHHPFDEGDAELVRRRTGPRTLVTTEKDAIKLRRLRGLPDDVRVLTLSLEWSDGWEPVEALLRSALEGRTS